MNIIIIDDDTIVSASLKTILEATGKIDVLATGSSGREAVELYKSLRPDIVLMDIQMPELSGLEAAKEILKNDFSAKILFLTTFSDDEYIVKALWIGAKGYILKHDYQSIASSLEAVMSGQSVFGTDVISKLPTLLNSWKKTNYQKLGISEKEEEIIALVAQGLNNREIAEKLFLSLGTVRNYLSAILDKLELRDRTQLAVFYYSGNREVE